MSGPTAPGTAVDPSGNQEIRTEAEVRLDGERVGAVAELTDGRVVFEYTDDFRRRGLEISPIHLPTSRTGPQSFDELREISAFRGLPGVLADSLPDSWGDRVIRTHLAARGESHRTGSLGPVERLLHLGERTLGALTYHPPDELPLPPPTREPLSVAALIEDVTGIVQGRAEVKNLEIFRIASPAGGRLPKALVLFDVATWTIRSGYAEPEPGDVPCVLKFDGVRAGAREGDPPRPLPFNRVEAAYGEMARAAGLETSGITVLETEGYAHLLVRRFDLDGEKRIHQHTLGGLLHVDFNEPGATSYEDYLRTVLQLGMPPAAVEQAYRRMVFNVLAVNHDDHPKNFSFHLGPAGEWSLAPAYDLTFAPGTGWTGAHQMTVAGKTAGITTADLLEVGRTFAVKRPERILEEVRSALAIWERYARRFGVPPDTAWEVRQALNERKRQLA